MPLAFLPMIVALYAQLNVAMKRITGFLVLPETVRYVILMSRSCNVHYREPLPPVDVPFFNYNHADFTWYGLLPLLRRSLTMFRPVAVKKAAVPPGMPPSRAAKRAAAKKVKEEEAKALKEGKSPSPPPAAEVKPPFGLHGTNTHTAQPTRLPTLHNNKLTLRCYFLTMLQISIWM